MELTTAFVLLIVSTLITYSMRPKVQPPKPEAFTDIEFPQFEEGTPQAVIFGDCWSGDWMVLAVGDYRTTEVRVDGGGKK